MSRLLITGNHGWEHVSELLTYPEIYCIKI